MDDFLAGLNTSVVYTKEEAEYLVNNKNVDIAIYETRLDIPAKKIYKYINNPYEIEIPLPNDYFIIDNVTFNGNRKVCITYDIAGFTFSAEEMQMIMTGAIVYHKGFIKITFLEEPQLTDVFSLSYRNYLVKPEHTEKLLKTRVSIKDVIYGDGMVCPRYVR